MSLKTTRQMPSFEGVAASSTATLRCPIGLTYHQLIIAYGGLAAGPGPQLLDIDEIRVVANGQVVQRIAGGLRLDADNQFEGRAAQSQVAAGELTLDFDRYNMRSRAGEEFTKLGTGFANDPTPIRTLSVEVDIGAGATNPTLEAKAIQSPPSALGVIKKIRNFNYNPAAAGDFQISDIPRGDLINKIYFRSANINSVRVERDNFTVFDRTKAENDTIQTDGVRVPIAGEFVYDPTESGNAAEGLVTAGVQDLRFIVDMSGAGALGVTVEYIGPLGN